MKEGRISRKDQRKERRIPRMEGRKKGSFFVLEYSY
jgi:hypothetical protein